MLVFIKSIPGTLRNTSIHSPAINYNRVDAVAPGTESGRPDRGTENLYFSSTAMYTLPITRSKMSFLT